MTASPAQSRFKRVLVKLSGEALQGAVEAAVKITIAG